MIATWLLTFCWICLQHKAEAVFVPTDKAALTAAVTACLAETTEGSCPTFAATDGNGVIGAWDVSKITDMGGVFKDKTDFNADLSEWLTTQVTSMAYLFYSAEKFNSDLSKVCCFCVCFFVFCRIAFVITNNLF